MSDERIPPALLGDRRLRAVSPEVRAADGTPEERVTREEEVPLLAFHPERKAPRCVAWSVEYVERAGAAGDAIAMDEEPVDDAWLVQRDPERLPLFAEVLVERAVALVHENRRARDALEERRFSCTRATA